MLSIGESKMPLSAILWCNLLTMFFFKKKKCWWTRLGYKMPHSGKFVSIKFFFCSQTQNSYKTMSIGKLVYSKMPHSGIHCYATMFFFFHHTPEFMASWWTQLAGLKDATHSIICYHVLLFLNSEFIQDDVDWWTGIYSKMPHSNATCYYIFVFSPHQSLYATHCWLVESAGLKDATLRQIC